MAFTSRQSPSLQQPSVSKSHQHVASISARHTRRAAALQPNVLAAERPPGYIQRPAKRIAKKQPRTAETQPNGQGVLLQEAAGANCEAAAEQQQQLEQQHAQQQLWKEQQLLLQEQWQKQHQQEQQQQQQPQQQLQLQQPQQKQQRGAQQRTQQPAHPVQQRQQQLPQQQMQQQQRLQQQQQEQQQQRRQGKPSAQGPQQVSSVSPAAAHVQQRRTQLRMQPAAAQTPLDRSASIISSSSSGAYTSAISSSSSSSMPRLVAAAPAYSVVPTATAPSVAAAATRAAAKAAATAAAAAGSASSSSGGLPAVLPRAEQCVPRQFWGLMNEELRPWHKQVLVQLCFCLPPPACYVYQEMRAGTMQGVLAQRAMLEKALRAGVVELEWQARRMRGWLDAVSRQQDPGCVAPESLQQAQQELLHLTASLGTTRSQLAALQTKACSYSDMEYVSYSSRFIELLHEMQELADVVRQQQAPLVHSLQETREAAARRALFAPTSAAAATAQRDAAAVVSAELARARPMCKDTARRLASIRHEMQQQLEWRYPPREYVLWRFKGRPGASKPPLAMPGLKRAVPAVRQGVQQLPQPQRD